MLYLYGDQVGASQVPVRASLDPRCPPIQGDAQQLRQVLHNLLQNAQDASEAAWTAGDAPVVEVLTQFVPGRQRVRLIVRDSGSGFPDHILKRAFEPYITTKAKGTGLGLAVVKKIADDHGARIAISNQLVHESVKGAQVSLSFNISTTHSADSELSQL